MAEQVTVRFGRETLTLTAFEDGFFEPLNLPDIANGLDEGISIESASLPRWRWIRSRRGLHVFTARPGVAGFATAPRAVIGQENVFLSSNEQAPAVLAFCQTTGAEAQMNRVRMNALAAVSLALDARAHANQFRAQGVLGHRAFIGDLG